MATAKKATTKPGFAANLTELSVVAGIARRTVSEWNKLPGFPKKTRYGYEIWAVAMWRAKREAEGKAKAGRPAAPGNDRRKAIELRTAEIEMNQKELKLKQLAGKLVDRESAKAAVARLFASIRARLEQFPAELAGSLPAGLRPDAIADGRHKTELLLREMEGWEFDGEL